MSTQNDFLTHVPPMGIYETLYEFQKAYGSYMGEKGTHPWSQGFPLTTKIPGGPELPKQVTVNHNDLKYPKAWGLPDLRKTIAQYYNQNYGSNINMENVMIFAGGRPGLIALLMFLEKDIEIQVASTEYTPYYDMLKLMSRSYNIIKSDTSNQFSPVAEDYFASSSKERKLALLSNPCNPTGITIQSNQLKQFVNIASTPNNGLLIDEAYELFHNPPISAMQYINNIDNSNIFVSGAATKGLQSPGIRIGWIVAAKKYVEILGNFSSFGMGGVSRPSQLYALELFNEDRIRLARTAIPAFYSDQRNRYAEKLSELGIMLYSGKGGFYHWCKLPGNLTGAEFNNRLFQYGAAILKGTDCDMYRTVSESHLNQFFRFSFGPLNPESFESDIKILSKALNSD